VAGGDAQHQRHPDEEHRVVGRGLTHLPSSLLPLDWIGSALLLLPPFSASPLDGMALDGMEDGMAEEERLQQLNREVAAAGGTQDRNRAAAAAAAAGEPLPCTLFCLACRVWKISLLAQELQAKSRAGRDAVGIGTTSHRKVEALVSATLLFSANSCLLFSCLWKKLLLLLSTRRRVQLRA
jgi:hypothetical protein